MNARLHIMCYDFIIYNSLLYLYRVLTISRNLFQYHMQVAVLSVPIVFILYNMLVVSTF